MILLIEPSVEEAATSRLSSASADTSWPWTPIVDEQVDSGMSASSGFQMAMSLTSSATAQADSMSAATAATIAGR